MYNPAQHTQHLHVGARAHVCHAIMCPLCAIPPPSCAAGRWRTALVIRELEEEIKALAAGRPHRDELKQLMAKKEIVGDLLNHLRLARQRATATGPLAAAAAGQGGAGLSGEELGGRADCVVTGAATFWAEPVRSLLSARQRCSHASEAVCWY